MVRVDEQVGLQEDGLKLHDAPVGSPEHEKLTLCALPATRVAVTLVVTLLP